MPESFDRSSWRARVAAWWQEHGAAWRAAAGRLGVSTAYGMLTASAWLPLLAAYSDNPGPAVTALVGVVGGVGSNLVANLVQGAYERARAPRQVEVEVAEQPELRAEYQEMLHGLGVVALAREALGEEWAAFAAALRQELAQMGGRLEDHSGGGAVILGDVRVSHGNFVGRDYIHHEHYYYSVPKPAGLRRAYLEHVVERCCYLPMRAVALGAADAAYATRQPRLARVYVALDVRTPATREKEGRAVFEMRPSEEQRPALQAVVQNRHLVLLGGPGSGKSTFLRHLAFCLAQAGLEPEADWLEQLPAWPAEETALLPVYLELRDLVRHIPQEDLTGGDARYLGELLSAWLKRRDLAEFDQPLREALREGKGIVLLDGLDEVSPSLREVVKETVAAFARTYKASRIVLTCRTLSYQRPVWQLAETDFPAVELAPFGEEKVDRFVGAWYGELADLGQVRPEDQDDLVERLQQALRRPRLRELATTPLLLTVMALVHAHRGQLPEARALLYEECIEVLLWRWEQKKGELVLRTLLQEVDLQEVDLKRALRTLAFEAHQDEEGAEAGIPEARLLKRLAQLPREKDYGWAQQVLEMVRERAGLLVEREPGVYAFPHRTFQEYLAGAHLAADKPDFVAQVDRLAWQGPFWWEVIRLAVGRQVYVAEDLTKPLALVAELCPAEKPGEEPAAEKPGEEHDWRSVWLAGEVLVEIGPRRAGLLNLGEELLGRVRRRLSALLQTPAILSPKERAAVGDVLGRLDDPRPGVGVDEEGLPDIAWVEVPGGEFTMGTKEECIPDLLERYGGEERWYKWEAPQHEVDLPAFYVARYPVTNAQFQAFLDDPAGYRAERWWTRAGLVWRGDRAGPERYGGSFDLPNHPVVGVSWYEAVAYSRWLGERLRAVADERLAQSGEEVEGTIWGGLRDGQLVVMLPSEAQWEKAALGTDGRTYPWGAEPDPDRANYSETGIGTTSAVGCFPGGRTPYGVEDMVGNVWEWCRTKWVGSYERYREREDDDLEGDAWRVLRGGAFYGSTRSVRCASRLRSAPDFRLRGYGFRLALVPPV